MRSFLFSTFLLFSQSIASPGGYLGISFQLDFKSKEKGFQFSTGITVPFIGEPGMGPYAFPGVALGLRHVKNSNIYSYIDIQIVASNAAWAGVGYGVGFKEGDRFLRKKYFLGFLPIGYVHESMRNRDSMQMLNNFKGIYLGGALPIIGSHFHP